MSPKEMTAFRLHPEVIEGMRTIKERDGVPYSVQVDRALRAWLEKRGVALDKATATGRATKTATRRRRA